MTRSLRPLLATTLIFLFAYALAVSQEPAMLSTRVLGQREIPGPAPEFRITFFEIGAGVPAASAGRCWSFGMTYA